jgi:1,4-alpha-glucan branching enzyme
LGKQPGDRWQQFAGLRLLFAYQWAQPGKKLLFMGGEFGVNQEWNHEIELDWSLLQWDEHAEISRWVADLNALLKAMPALHQQDSEPGGFQWVIGDDAANSVFAFIRYGREGAPLLFVANFTPVPRHDYRLGVPQPGTWTEVLNGDDVRYGGSGVLNPGPIASQDEPSHGFGNSIQITVPPLTGVFLTLS